MCQLTREHLPAGAGPVALPWGIPVTDSQLIIQLCLFRYRKPFITETDTFQLEIFLTLTHPAVNMMEKPQPQSMQVLQTRQLDPL